MSEHSSGGLQALIVKELQRVNSSLDAVEDSMGDQRHRQRGHRDSVELSTPKHLPKSSYKGRKRRKSKLSTVVSESLSDEEVLPSLSAVRSYKDIQKRWMIE